jgi:hypothetical protein
MDALSLIPFASGVKLAAKTPRILKAIPIISKLALGAGMMGLVGTLKKMGEILVDPSRSLKELDMQDARNLSMIGSLGIARKNTLANRTVGKTTQTFEVVSPTTKAKTKIEISDAQLKELNTKKSVAEKKAYLKEVVAKKVDEGALAPELKTAEPVVDRVKLKVWESSPIKGKAVTKETTKGNTEFKHNLNDESAWSRYLARTREVSTKNPFAKSKPAATPPPAGGTPPPAGTPPGGTPPPPAGGTPPPPGGTPPGPAPATPDVTKARRTALANNIVDTRGKLKNVETELADVQSKLRAEVGNAKPDDAKITELTKKGAEL